MISCYSIRAVVILNHICIASATGIFIHNALDIVAAALVLWIDNRTLLRNIFLPFNFPLSLQGWGLVSCPNPDTNPYCEGGRDATVLQELELPVVSREVCLEAVTAAACPPSAGCDRGDEEYLTNLVSKQFCFGGEAGRSSCFGDSGSPVVVTSTRTDGTTKYR